MIDFTRRFWIAPMVLLTSMAIGTAQIPDDDNGPLDDSDINDGPDVFVPLNAVPLAALNALRGEVGGFAFDTVELDRDSGFPHYALEWVKDGRVVETTVGAEGDLVKRDEKVAIGEVPDRVQQASAGFFPPGVPVEVEYSLSVSYVIEEAPALEESGAPRWIEVNPIGQVVAVGGFDVMPISEPLAIEGPVFDSGYLIKRSVDLSLLPGPTKRRFSVEFGEGTPVSMVQRETYIGSSTFEATWMELEETHKARVSDSGEMLERSQTIPIGDIPSVVAERAVEAFSDASSLEYRRKLTSTYEVDVDLPSDEYQLVVEPGGRIVRASGFPHPMASAPRITREGDAIVVSHRALLGFPRPRLEVAPTLESSSWSEVPMQPVGESRLEARVPLAHAGFFRIRLGDGAAR